MEKLLFLFPRKDGLTSQEFFDHYLQVHAHLGVELTRTMRHYVVNLHDGEDHAPEGVDAFTETWVDSITSFFDLDETFASSEDAQRLMDDHNSFIGDPYSAYTVEEHVRSGPTERPGSAPGPTPGAKAIVRVGDASTREAVVAAALADANVTAVVENRVLAAVMPGSRDADGFVSVWSAAPVLDVLDAAAGDGGEVYAVTEHVRK